MFEVERHLEQIEPGVFRNGFRNDVYLNHRKAKTFAGLSVGLGGVVAWGINVYNDVVANTELTQADAVPMLIGLGAAMYALKHICADSFSSKPAKRTLLASDWTSVNRDDLNR